MTAKNLSTITNDLIVSYGNTARNVIHAYRAGGSRVIRFVDRRWETALEKSARRLEPEVRGNAAAAQRKISGFYVTGIELASSSAEVVVDKMVELAGIGVHRLAANAAQLEKSTGFTALNTVAQAATPAVQAVGKLASKIEQKSGLLAAKVEGQSPVSDAAVKRVTPVRKARPGKNAT